MHREIRRNSIRILQSTIEQFGGDVRRADPGEGWRWVADLRRQRGRLRRLLARSCREAQEGSEAHGRSYW